MERLIQNFGKQLKARRIEHGWSLRQVAEKADIPHVTVHMIETGVSDPKLSNLTKLAKAFGEDFHQFTGACGL